MSDDGIKPTRRDVVKALAAMPFCAFGCGTSDLAKRGRGTPRWATGGTAAMVAMASYPDPFEVLGTTCTVTCRQTLGPCHTTSPLRSDISDGLDGLPVRLMLRVVDEACEPVEDVVVEVWHTNHRGSYSGAVDTMCNESSDDADDGYFRGYQHTDVDGVVTFDTCYPGWYPGRAVHVHFRVQTGAYDADSGASAEVVSQLYFADALNAEIFETQPLYADFGPPNRTLESDHIIGDADDPSPYVFDVQRMGDGVMLASATIVLSESRCSV